MLSMSRQFREFEREYRLEVAFGVLPRQHGSSSDLSGSGHDVSRARLRAQWEREAGIGSDQSIEEMIGTISQNYRTR